MTEMNAWTYDYDREVDVLSITFGKSDPAEPSVMHEVSDGVLLAVGQFSRNVVGMRVVGARALGLDALTSALLSAGEKSRKLFLDLSAEATRHAYQSNALKDAEEFLKKHSKDIGDPSNPLFV